MRRFIAPMILFLAACSSDDGGDGIEFTTGEFDVATTVVDDQCLDGGLNLLFMPEGTDTPWGWPNPVRIHGDDDLPQTYSIELREPFGEMTVTAQVSGSNRQTLNSDTNVGVLLGPEFGDCVADMTATVDVVYATPDRADGVADLRLSNPRGDDRCPVEMPDSCTVLLSFEAERR